MSIREKPVRTACVAVLAGLVFGCGSPARDLGQQALGNVGQMQMPPAAQATEGMSADESRVKQIIDQLNLTPEQQSKIQALMQRLSEVKGEAIQQRVAALKNLLATKDIDIKQLADHIRQDRMEIGKRLQSMIDVIAGIRDNLTDEQRAKIADMKASAPDGDFQEFANELQLTDQQKQALAALRPVAADISLQDAVHAFMRSGDLDALRVAIATSIARLPSADMIARGLATLSPEQRAKLVQLVADRSEAMQDQTAEAP